MSETDTGPELRVGQYGLRTFHVSEDGYLLPLNAGIQDSRLNASWKDGTCIAQCGMECNHPVPDDECRCGIYSFPSVEQVRSQYPSGYNLLAVVSLEGRVIEGEYGWRSEAARIVAIWTPPEVRWRSSDLGRVTNQLKTNYPNIAFREDLDTMIEDYEGLSRWGNYPAGRTERIDTYYTGTVTRAVHYLALAIRPVPLILLAGLTFIAAHPPPTGPGWLSFLSHGMLVFHQGELQVAAHPLWVTALGGLMFMPRMPMRRHRWRRSLLSALLGATYILSLEAACVVLALTAHSSVGWLDLLIGVAAVVGQVPLLVFMPPMLDRLEHRLFMTTRRSCGLVQPGVRVAPVWPPA